jgi:multisubunit Na+/H+ antiporter MnhG subunit
MQTVDHDAPPPFWRSRFGAGCLVLASVAAWFLWSEHRIHLLGALPYLVLLACPLMHVFMHRGHHHGARRNDDAAADHQAPRGPGAQP